MTVVSKSGTNDLHGSGLLFFRDKALTARTVFEAERPDYRRWQYGGTFGGPIVEDRTHVFGAYEADHQDTARIVAHSASNPFASRENGIFPARFDERIDDLPQSHP